MNKATCRRHRARSSLSNRHTPRHSAYRSQFIVIEYPWHPLHGERQRVYRRRGKQGRQILYIEVEPGISRELPAWMADAAACAAMSPGSPEVVHLNELRAVPDSHWAKPAAALSSSRRTRRGQMRRHAAINLSSISITAKVTPLPPTYRRGFRRADLLEGSARKRALQVDRESDDAAEDA